MTAPDPLPPDAAPPPGSWWRDRALWAATLPAFLVSRFVLLLVGLLAVAKFPLNPATAGADLPGVPAPLRIWARWDANWYLSIVRDGYHLRHDGESNAAFFPLYPALIRGVGALLGGGNAAWIAAGVLGANGALLAALILLYRETRRDLGADVARRACLLLCIVPPTLFLSAVYPMSLGLALSLGAYAAARRGRWWAAGALGGLAALTRFEGLLLMVPLAVAFVDARRRAVAAGTRPPGIGAAAGLLLTPLATALWCGYLAWRLGDPLAFRTALSHWSTGAAMSEAGRMRRLLDWAMLAGFAALLPVCVRRLRPAFATHAAVYTLLLTALGVTGTVSFASTLRYGLNLFPCLLAVAYLTRRAPWAHDALTVLSTGLAALCMLAFALLYWVA